MSKHSYKEIDQKEYLKKYLYSDKTKKKKKHKKHKSARTVKIVDDDINHIDYGIQIDEELLLVGEDAPQIVGEYIEEQPQEKGKSENKWKSIAVKEEPYEDNKNINGADAWNHKVVEFNIKKEKTSLTPEKTIAQYKNKRKTSRKRSVSQNSSNYDENGKTKSIKRRNLTPDQSPPRKYGENANKKHSKELPVTSNNRLSCSDQSPPRKSSKERQDAKSSRRHRSPSDDQSPPRRRTNDERRQDTESSRRHRSPSNDQSPPRRRTNDERRQDTESSRRHRSPSNDQSPPRRRTNDERRRDTKSSLRHRSRSHDQSPPRRRANDERRQDAKSSRHNHSSSNDQSPFRHQRKALGNTRKDPKTKRRDRSSSNEQRQSRKNRIQGTRETLKSNGRQHLSSNDRSTSRTSERKYKHFKNTRHSSSKSQSPSHGKSNKDNITASYDSKVKNHRLSSKEEDGRVFNRSPQKSKRNLSSKHQHSPNSSRSRSRMPNKLVEKSLSPPPTHKPKASRTLDGKKAGLQNAEALKDEIANRAHKEELMLEQMPSELSGRDAEVQVRSTGRLGRKGRMARDENSTERNIREAKEQETKLKYERWGKGLKQIEDYCQRKAEEEYESSKPLARYANDEDLDKYLREKEYAEDPMLEYMRQKRKEKEKLSDEPKKPIYEGAYPENRFGIRPGYRWDGVDRSNGYEKKWLAAQNERRAKQEEAYKYSVEDM